MPGTSVISLKVYTPTVGAADDDGDAPSGAVASPTSSATASARRVASADPAREARRKAAAERRQAYNAEQAELNKGMPAQPKQQEALYDDMKPSDFGKKGSAEQVAEEVEYRKKNPWSRQAGGAGGERFAPWMDIDEERVAENKKARAKRKEAEKQAAIQKDLQGR